MKAPERVELELRRLRIERWRVVYVVDEDGAEVGVLTVRRRPPYNYEDIPDILKGLSDDEA